MTLGIVASSRSLSSPPSSSSRNRRRWGEHLHRGHPRCRGNRARQSASGASSGAGRSAGGSRVTWSSVGLTLGPTRIGPGRAGGRTPRRPASPRPGSCRSRPATSRTRAAAGAPSTSPASRPSSGPRSRRRFAHIDSERRHSDSAAPTIRPSSVLRLDARLPAVLELARPDEHGEDAEHRAEQRPALDEDVLLAGGSDDQLLARGSPARARRRP